MTTTAVKHLRLDPKVKEKLCRPDHHTPIDELFSELILQANEVKGLLDFARGLYAENNTDKVDASAVFAFVQAVSMPMFNVVDSIRYLEFELKEREKERRV
jgi:hypothetical protein